MIFSTISRSQCSLRTDEAAQGQVEVKVEVEVMEVEVMEVEVI